MKEISKSGEPDYIIIKLLMNSLYGRFGMNPEYLLLDNPDRITK